MPFPAPVPTTRHEDARFAAVLVYGAWAAFGLHAAALLFFFAIDLYALAIFNVASSSLYLVCIVLARRIRFSPALALIALEVIAHAAFAVFTLGPSSAFHFYLFALAPIVSFNPRWRVSRKAVFLALVFLLYVGIDYTSRFHAQPVFVGAPLLMLMRYFNVAAVFGFLGYLSYYYARAAQQAEETLNALATTDPLTRLANRRRILEVAEYEMARWRRSGQPLAAALVDADDFKALNDRFGHECGDRVLQEIAARLRQSLRAQDHIGRWGGEEFILLLPNTDLVGAFGVAEKLRGRITGRPISYKHEALTVTVSIGVCEFRAGDDFAACVARADQALMAAKRHGKNRVEALAASGV